MGNLLFFKQDTSKDNLTPEQIKAIRLKRLEGASEISPIPSEPSPPSSHPPPTLLLPNQLSSQLTEGTTIDNLTPELIKAIPLKRLEETSEIPPIPSSEPSPPTLLLPNQLSSQLPESTTKDNLTSEQIKGIPLKRLEETNEIPPIPSSEPSPPTLLLPKPPEGTSKDNLTPEQIKAIRLKRLEEANEISHISSEPSPPSSHPRPTLPLSNQLSSQLTSKDTLTPEQIKAIRLKRLEETSEIPPIPSSEPSPPFSHPPTTLLNQLYSQLTSKDNLTPEQIKAIRLKRLEETSEIPPIPSEPSPPSSHPPTTLPLPKQLSSQLTSKDNLTPEQIKAIRLKRLEETSEIPPIPSEPSPPSSHPPPTLLLPSDPFSFQSPPPSSVSSSNLPPTSQEKDEVEVERRIAAVSMRSLPPKNIKGFLEEKKDENNKLSELFSLNLCETKSESKKGYFNIISSARLLDLSSMDNYIEEILSSPAGKGSFFKSQEEKVDYIFNALENLDTYFIDSPPPLPLKTCLFNFLISLILTPSIYNISLSAPKFVSFSLLSPSSSNFFSPPPSSRLLPPPPPSSISPSSHLTPPSLEERFFKRLLEVEPSLLEAFLKYLSTEFSSDDVDELMEGVFMRILEEVNANAGIKTIRPVVNSLCFLDAILKVDYFLNYYIQKSRAFYPPNLIFGLGLQKQNILCSALSISTLPEESKAWELYWKDGGGGRRRDDEKVVKVVREKLKEVGLIVYEIFERILNSNESNRCRLISFLLKIISLNKDKTKLFSFNSPLTSKNGFLLNFLKLLFRLCLPFIDDMNQMQDKLDKVNVNFFNSPLVSKLLLRIETFNPEKCKEEGGGGGGEGGAKGVGGVGRGEGVGGEGGVGEGGNEGLNFMTQIFFITTYFIHMVQIIYKNYYNFLVKMLEEAKINRNSLKFALLLSQKYAYDVMIADPFLIENFVKTFAFCSMLSFHLLSFHPPSLSSPSPSSLSPTVSFAKLPLYFADDMYEFLMVLLQAMPDQMKTQDHYFLIICHFMLVCMGNKNLITNPHTRAKFLVFLSMLGGRKNEKGRRVDVIFNHFLTKDEYFQKHLINCLIDIFIDVEKLGSHNQFFEKFNYRNRFCLLMAYLLTDIGGVEKPGISLEEGEGRGGKEGSELEVGKGGGVGGGGVGSREEKKEQEENNYKWRLKVFSMGNEEKMLIFYNLFLNDLIFTLDESLKYLKSIKIYEDNEESMSTLSDEEQNEKKKKYEESKKNLKIFLDILSPYYENISLMSSFVSDVILSEALREKMVFNLNYTIEALNGKNALELKVKNMKQLNFDPKFILKCIIQLYLKLSHEPVFLETIVKDERSFNPLTFHKTKNILIKNSLLYDEEVEAFDRMLHKLNQLLASQQATDELLHSSLPEIYLDPITNEIMKDPVLLPTSKVIIDRMTIIKHLLSDPTDPYNRQPLKKENLVEMPEKKEIEEWIVKMMEKGRKNEG